MVIRAHQQAATICNLRGSCPVTGMVFKVAPRADNADLDVHAEFLATGFCSRTPRFTANACQQGESTLACDVECGTLLAMLVGSYSAAARDFARDHDGPNASAFCTKARI